jgi:hypothetical protein
MAFLHDIQACMHMQTKFPETHERMFCLYYYSLDSTDKQINGTGHVVHCENALSF